MKITLISLDNWGLNKNIAICLENKGHDVTHIDFNKFKYKYPNFLYRILNFFLKIFFRKNLKTMYYGKKIIKILEKKNTIQDVILTIKSDFIDPKSLIEFKRFTKKSVAFFNDSIARYPKTKGVLNCFDEVYSFEKGDCEKYGLKFKTNFVCNFNEKTHNNHFENQLFTISSRDRRTKTIFKIAQNLKMNTIDYKIIIFDGKNKIKDNDLVDIVRKPMPLKIVNQYIDKSKVLLDIHRKRQSGLTFRVFESLGLEKKLVTTNSDIKNYDFYNPNNILIIDAQDPVFPKSFFETTYEPVPAVVLKKYLLENWIEEFLN
jgi:hypothetical protein